MNFVKLKNIHFPYTPFHINFTMLDDYSRLYHQPSCTLPSKRGILSTSHRRWYRNTILICAEAGCRSCQMTLQQTLSRVAVIVLSKRPGWAARPALRNHYTSTLRSPGHCNVYSWLRTMFHWLTLKPTC